MTGVRARAVTGIRARSVAVIGTWSETGNPGSLSSQGQDSVWSSGRSLLWGQDEHPVLDRHQNPPGAHRCPLTRLYTKAGTSHPRTTDPCPDSASPGRVPQRGPSPSVRQAASGGPGTARRGCGRQGSLIPARPPCISRPSLPPPPAAGSVCSLSLPLPLSALETAISLP